MLDGACLPIVVGSRSGGRWLVNVGKKSSDCTTGGRGWVKSASEFWADDNELDALCPLAM